MSKILIVDDDKSILMSMQQLLTTWFEVDTASTGSDGLQLTLINSYDAVLLDVHLEGGISGLQLAKILHEDAPEITIFFMSATHYDDATMSQAKSHGATEFFQKPIKDSEINLILTILQK